jgi:mediator of replication checkpoint protein 1
LFVLLLGLYSRLHRFLTQTRPNGDADAYRNAVTPTASQTTSRLSSGSRQPLRTLSYDRLQTESMEGSDDESVLSDSQPTRSRRLVKRDRSTARALDAPADGSNDMDTPFKVHHLPPPKDRSKEPKSMHPKKTFEKSEYVDGEAQESDEDEQFGFGKLKDQDDEEEGEHLDENLASLVDDQHMDEDTEAVDKVMERYQEDAAADDQKLYQYHYDAAHGGMRKKRRKNGVGMDDSDDEDDSDEERNRKLRRGMYKKLRTNRQDMNALGETFTFFRHFVYRSYLSRGE